MTKTNLVSKLLFPLIILAGSIFVGNQSAFAFNINIGNQSGSTKTGPASNGTPNGEITTTYTGVPIPNFPGRTMTCTIIDDESVIPRFQASCSNETLSPEDLPDNVTIEDVISQFTPFNNESKSKATGEKFDADTYIPGAIKPRQISIDFTVTITSDSRTENPTEPKNLIDRSYDGSLRYYSLGFIGVGEESLSVSNLSFRFLGTNYTHESDTGFMIDRNPFLGSEVLFSDGDLLGLSFNSDQLNFSEDRFNFFGEFELGGSVEYILPQASLDSPPAEDRFDFFGEPNLGGSVEYILPQASPDSPDSPPASVPEPSAIFGLLMFSAMGYSSKLKKLKVKSQK